MKEIIPKANNGGGIIIQFRFENNKYSIAPVRGGKFSDPNDYGRAMAVAMQISLDIDNGRFDTTMASYKPRNIADLKRQVARANQELEQIREHKVCIVELWSKYIEYKRPSVSPSTYKTDYVRRVGNALQQLPTTDIFDAIAIRDYLIGAKPAAASKKIITQLSACCDWAKDSKLIRVNPFDGMAAKIKQLKRSEDEDINPFTAEERDLIINAFYSHKLYKHYAPLVEFIFTVGCRPSEAIALTWGDISKRELTFNGAYVEGELQNRLKTQGKRCILINTKLAKVLEPIKPETINKDALVFPSPEGLYIDWHNFNNRAWKKVLNSLPDIEYRNPYQMRHTFITLAIKASVSLTDIAKACGNSPKMILERYSGVTRDFMMPVF